jgi:type III secretory pathway component EscR
MDKKKVTSIILVLFPIFLYLHVCFLFCKVSIKLIRSSLSVFVVPSLKLFRYVLIILNFFLNLTFDTKRVQKQHRTKLSNLFTETYINSLEINLTRNPRNKKYYFFRQKKTLYLNALIRTCLSYSRIQLSLRPDS